MEIVAQRYVYTVGTDRVLSGTIPLHEPLTILPPARGIIGDYYQLVMSVPKLHWFVCPISRAPTGDSSWLSLGVRGKPKVGETDIDAVTREGFEEFGMVPTGFHQAIDCHCPQNMRTTRIYLSTHQQVKVPSPPGHQLFNQEPDDYQRRVIWLIHGPKDDLLTLGSSRRPIPLVENAEDITGYAILSRTTFLTTLRNFAQAHQHGNPTFMVYQL